jgi:peptidoglycan/xylan/chitin deacetylase (PgdA/CDA1 family)
MKSSAQQWAIWGLARLHRLGLAVTARQPRIVMYHSIVQDGSPYARTFPGKYVEERIFRLSMAYIRQYCHVLSLDGLLDGYENGFLFPPNAIVVTFDDGYANNYERAAHILGSLGIPATFFVTTGFVDGMTSLWTDTVDRYAIERGGLPSTLRHMAGLGTASQSDCGALFRALKRVMKRMPPQDRAAWLSDLHLDEAPSGVARDALAPLTWEQTRQLAQVPGMAVAPHTVTHPSLSGLSDNAVRSEIAGSWGRLKEEAVTAARFFAYPYGDAQDFSTRHVAVLRDLAFRCALGTRPGLVSSDDDLYALPRYEGKNDLNEFIWHASGVQNLMSRWKRSDYESDRRTC